MWNPVVILVLCLCSFVYAVPLGLKKNMAIVQEEEEPMLMLAADEETRPEVMISRLNLPSNATSIRADITDGFSCDNKTYGYYADVENECQIFHVCLPVTYADGKENTFRWSFICPEETVFSQDSFTCMRPEDMSIDCEESFKYYELNRNFGVVESEDSFASAEEEMNMEEMSRQPSSQEIGEEIRQTVVAAPSKKQTVKVPSRRKTQTNRNTIEAQRKKVQPMRKTPQLVAPATTAKTVEEDAILLEQEAERTTVKYQRFTKRPVTAMKEQPKPEVSKPEQQIIRQELFTQKRKRPQIFTATRLDAAVQTEDETEPEAAQKTHLVPDQAEAQASEIAEISIKPQVEKVAEPMPMEAEKGESLAVKEKEPEMDQPSDVRSEIAPMPEKTPSRVEVVEIPIQKVDEPLLGVVPLPEEPKPFAVAMEPMKDEEEKLRNEELLAEETIQAELTKATEVLEKQGAEKMAAETPAKPENAMEAEKVLFEPAVEPEKVLEGNESENLLEAVKAVEIPSEPEVPMVLEPVKALETLMGPEMAAAEPEILFKAEIAEPEKMSESKAEVPAPELVMPLKTEAEPELDVQKKDEIPRIEVPAPVPALETEPEKSESETLLKVESPIADPEKPQEVEVPAPEPEMPLRVEAPIPEMPLVEEPLRLETPAAEPEKPLEAEVSTPDLDMTKTVVAVEVPMALAEKPAKAELPAEPMSMANPEPQMPLEADQSEAQLEKSRETQAEGEIQQSAEQMEAQPQTSGEEDSVPSASDNEDAQSLILDFISSLVNSENSNLEEQGASMGEMQSGNMLEPTAPDSKLPEEKAPEVQAEQEPQPPLYMPLMQNNDQMYQIPVQIIETPEPELPMPVPAPAEPKLPLSIDDVVELVKESLDTPAEKENLIQAPSANQPESQPDSDEVKPIYHRYFEVGSNLLKSEALTASDEDEPTVIAISNDNSMAQEDEPQPSSPMDPMSELPKASEKLPEPEQLASEPAMNSPPQADTLPSESASAADRLAMSRSMNRFKMDPRKRRFLFRSDAS